MSDYPFGYDFENSPFAITFLSLFSEKDEYGISYADDIDKTHIKEANENNEGPLNCGNCQFYACKNGISYGLCGNCAIMFGGPAILSIDDDFVPVLEDTVEYFIHNIIFRLPIVSDDIVSDDFENTSFECPICLESYEAVNKVVLHCSESTEHIFCQECISQWISRGLEENADTSCNCPMCREEITIISSRTLFLP